MMTRFYSYPLSIKVAKALGWLMMLFLLTCAFLSIGAVLKEYGLAELTEILPVTLSLLGGSLVFLLIMNGYPNIGINEYGLQVQFMWWYIDVPWVDIVAIEESVFVMIRSTRVKARRITWLHYVYGLSHPAVMIYSNIDNYTELLREIKFHTTTCAGNTSS